MEPEKCQCSCHEENDLGEKKLIGRIAKCYKCNKTGIDMSKIPEGTVWSFAEGNSQILIMNEKEDKL
jgi:hypothetical protein